MQEFSHTYERFHRPLIAYAMSFLPQEEAEDVVHEVFSRVLAGGMQFGSEREARNFLYLSVRNKCLDTLKHKAVVRGFIAEASQTMDRDTEDEIFAGEIYARLFANIDSLPRRQRETMLQFCEGKSNAEIAVAMNVSLDTVKNQKFKAIATLKKLLKNRELLIVAMLQLTVFNAR